MATNATPIGTPTPMAVVVGVTMSGDNGKGTPFSQVVPGWPWAINLGNGVIIEGSVQPGAHIGDPIFDGGIVYNQAAGASSTFSGASGASIMMSWMEQRYLLPYIGEVRAVVGNITCTCNDGSISFVPRISSVTGLPTAPDLWVIGEIQYARTFGPEETISATVAMICSQIGLSSTETFSLYPQIAYNAEMIDNITEADLGSYESGSWSEDGKSGSFTVSGSPTGGFHTIVSTTPSAIGAVNFGPPSFDLAGGTGGVEGGDIIWGSVTTPSSAAILTTVAKDTISIESEAKRFPKSIPVNGVPICLWNGQWGSDLQCDNRLSPFPSPANHVLLEPATHTDKDGKGPTTSLTVTGLPSPLNNAPLPSDCVVSGSIGRNTLGEASHGSTFVPWPTSPVAGDDDHYLFANNLDPRGSNVPGFSSAACVDMYTFPTLLTVTRATSLSIDDGSDHHKWETIKSVNLPPTDFTTPAEDVTLSTVAGGISFGTVANHGSTYGIARQLDGASAGLRRGFRHFRYLRVRITADTKSTARLGLYNNIAINPITGKPSPLLAIDFHMDLVPGENVFVLDLMRSYSVLNHTTNNVAAPWIAEAAHQTDGDSTDPLGLWSLHTFQSTTMVSAYSAANPLISQTHPRHWQDYDVLWMRIDTLTVGTQYLLEEITAFDRTEGNRTPLRVLGHPCPAQASNPANLGAAIDGSTGTPAYIFRVLANGRCSAGFPSCYTEDNVPINVDTLVDRWRDTIDGGANVWTITNNRPDLTATIPPNWLEVVPGSVTATGFQLRARAVYSGVPSKVNANNTSGFPLTLPQPIVNVGWSTFVNYPIKVQYNWGSQVEGVAMDAQTRRAMPGKTITLQMTNLPSAATPQNAIGTTDDDGYFAIVQDQPIRPLAPGYELVPKFLNLIADRSGPSTQPFQCTERNILPLILYVNPNIPSRVANLTTRDGAFHRIARSFYHLQGSTSFSESGAFPGRNGLSYWRYDGGSPRAWNSYGWTLKASIITEGIVDDYPTIHRRSDGRLYVMYDRQTAATPIRKADVWETFSDDDGKTWSDPKMIIPTAQYPRSHVGQDGSIYRVGYVDDGTGQGVGTLKGQFQYAGDTNPSPVFTLRKADDSGHLVPIVIQSIGGFDIHQLWDSAARWILSVVEVGSTTPTEYVSADDAGGTFVRLGSATAGMEIGPGGSMAFTAAAFETSANVPPTGVQTVDGMTTGDNQVVDLGANIDPVQRGLWVTSTTGPWQRPVWMASGSTVQPGAVVFIAPGGSNGGQFVNMTNTDPVTIDSDAQYWAPTVSSATLAVQTDVFTASGGTGTTVTLTQTPVGSLFLVMFDGVLQTTASWALTGLSLNFAWNTGEGPTTIQVIYTRQ